MTPNPLLGRHGQRRSRLERIRRVAPRGELGSAGGAKVLYAPEAMMTSAARPALERHRRWALHRLLLQRLSTGFASRAAFALGMAVAIGFAGWMLTLHWNHGVDEGGLLAIRGVKWLSVVAGGIVTWGLGADLQARDATDGITALLDQRGYDTTRLQSAYLFATMRLIGGTIGIPTGMLAVLNVALSPSVPILLGRLLLTVGVAGYVVALSAVLALAARWAAAIDRLRSRWVLAALLVGPDLARAVGAEVPSVASLFGVLLDHVAKVGVAFT